MTAHAHTTRVPGCHRCELSADEATTATIRAQALLAAAAWLPWRWGQSMTDAETDLLAAAERFARWIESGERSA